MSRRHHEGEICDACNSRGYVRGCRCGKCGGSGYTIEPGTVVIPDDDPMTEEDLAEFFKETSKLFEETPDPQKRA